MFGIKLSLDGERFNGIFLLVFSLFSIVSANRLKKNVKKKILQKHPKNIDIT